MVAVIIVAAGRGRRMRAALPKQVLPLAGRPLAEHSLRAFQHRAEVDRIVLVVSPSQRALFPLKLRAYPKLVALADGGETRQESVRRGLEEVGTAEWVLIHDAARPLVDGRLIGAVLQAARESGAAVPGCRVGDTVKGVEGRSIAATLMREEMILVQTPQAFRTELIRRAHQAAVKDGFLGTDDAQLVERLGEPVTWVEGSPLNLKITTQEDLKLADALIRCGAAEPGF